MKIIHVVGARPNFMKMAPVYCALEKYEFNQLIVHTGQHYNDNMSDIFFRELNINHPDFNLRVGSDSHARQVADIMIKFEKIINDEQPDLVLVYGDVNSTLAASLVCAKLGIKIGHIEAGLRSRDLSMPEEINRIVTDRLANYYFTPSIDADLNLINEGVNKENIYFVGNVMIDTLVKSFNLIKNNNEFNITENKYGVVTIHRPSNVDDPNKLNSIVEVINKISDKIPLIFPIHPRTKKQLDIRKQSGLILNSEKIYLVDPLGYFEFMKLVNDSQFVITDSGGIQEETTYLGIPCLTLRHNTERPITVDQGTNILIGDDFDLLKKEVNCILFGNYKKGIIPEKWDGKASERIANIINNIL